MFWGVVRWGLVSFYRHCITSCEPSYRTFEPGHSNSPTTLFLSPSLSLLVFLSVSPPLHWYLLYGWTITGMARSATGGPGQCQNWPLHLSFSPFLSLSLSAFVLCFPLLFYLTPTPPHTPTHTHTPIITPGEMNDRTGVQSGWLQYL